MVDLARPAADHQGGLPDEHHDLAVAASAALAEVKVVAETLQEVERRILDIVDEAGGEMLIGVLNPLAVRCLSPH